MDQSLWDYQIKEMVLAIGLAKKIIKMLPKVRHHSFSLLAIF